MAVPAVPPVPLSRVEAHLRRYVSYPTEEALVAHVLWIAHTHIADAFDNTPRLAVLSPEPGSGKSRVLEVTELLVPRPVLTVNATTAYIFRKISDEAGLPTLLIDEVDSIFSPRKSDVNEELRGLLNSGYRRGASAGRAAIRGKEIVTEEWPSFCPVALAGLGNLPDTIATRSVTIRMKRRRHGEKLEPYRRRIVEPQSSVIRDELADWASSIRNQVENNFPVLPAGIEDRDADIWEPLIAIADQASTEWSERARSAAMYLVGEAQERPVTLGIRLLVDIKSVLRGEGRVSTSELLGRLHDLDEAPWSSIKGEPIDGRFLGRMLGQYDIHPTKIRFGTITAKGYYESDFTDAFERYTSTPEGGEQGERSEQEEQHSPAVPLVPDVPLFGAGGRGAA